MSRTIDVDELLKRLNQLYEEQGLTPEPTGADWDDGAGSIFDDIVEIINEQPTIEFVKRGKWNPHEYGGQFWFKCSLCGNVVLLMKKHSQLAPKNSKN